jgi:hypothetical protein
LLQILKFAICLVLSGYGWTAARPWPGRFKLRRQAKKGCFVPKPAYKVDTHGKSLSIPVEGNGHGRLAGGIADRREGNESLRTAETSQRIFRRRVEASQSYRRFTERGGEDNIVLEEKSGNVSRHPLKRR